jgi:xanthine dehydrogenase accessory factor
MGHDVARVVRAPSTGVFAAAVLLNDRVTAGDTLGTVGSRAAKAQIDGQVRGLIRDGTFVKTGVKIGDIEPREYVNNDLVSDKALALAGAVLEAVLFRYNS